jgi:hypothetical protein
MLPTTDQCRLEKRLLATTHQSSIGCGVMSCFILLYIDPELWQKARARCIERNETLMHVIERLLQQWLIETQPD